MTPAWLTEALGPRWLGSARVEEIVCEPLGQGEGFVGELARLRLRLDRDAPDAPDRLIAKLPTQVAANRAVGEMLGAYEREILFYRELAPRVGYRTAQLYHADMDENPASKYGPALVRLMDRLPARLIRWGMAFFRWLGGKSARRYVLLIEDLAPAELGDQVAGRSPSECECVVRSMAEVQAAFWRSELLADRYWVSQLDLGLRIAHQMYRDSRPVFEARFAERLAPADRTVLDWLDANAIALLGALHSDAPPTLVHGDFRLDNLFFDGDEAPWVVDWQGVARGPGVVDLAYFLSGTLPVTATPEDEVGLVRLYHDTLLAGGVDGYDRETCWRDYRRCTVLGVHRLVTIDWVELGEERGAALIDLWVERLMARVRRIDLDSLL